MSLPLWLRWFAVNLLFVAFHPWFRGTVPGPATALAIGALLFVVPAAGWTAFFEPRTRALGMRLAGDVALSTGFFFAMLVAFKVAGLTPTRMLAWNSMWAVTNVGFLLSTVAGRRIANRRSLASREVVLGGMLFAGAYALYFLAATRIVPPMVDHDLEVQGNGYALLTRFEPLELTDRRTVYYFAHPPLLHFYVGGSFLYSGTFPDLEFFDASSRRVRDAREGRAFEAFAGTVHRVGKDGKDIGPHVVVATNPPDYLLGPSREADSMRAPIEQVELGLIYDRYRTEPHLIETRAPNLFFAAATVALLGIWAARISRRWWIAVLTAVTYATSPEVMVRSSYGGYFAVGLFATVLMLLAAEHWARWPKWRYAIVPALTGVLAALSDHKMVLVPAAIALWVMVVWLWRQPLQVRFDLGKTMRGALRLALHPVVVGFAAGMGLFWTFGLAVNPAAFIEDHLHNHLLDRITHVNPLGYHQYPTIMGLWREFARHTGYVLLPVAAAVMVLDVVRSRPPLERGPLRGAWLLITLLTGTVFTAIDWRMTKHLAPMLLPLHLALVPPRVAPRWRAALPVLALVFVLVSNARWLRVLIDNFDRFAITPAW